MTRLRETTLRHIGALPPGQPVRAVANNLAMLLTLKAYPNALAPDERRLSIANVLPDRLRPYLDAPRFEGDLRWSGRTEFEREDTRKRFLANERGAYTRRVPDPEAGPLTVGYALKVIYPDTINPGDGAKELVVLYRTGSSLGGPAIVTAVYRAMQPPSGQRTAFEDAVKQHYAGTSVEIGGNGRAWMDSPARRSAFVPDRCGAFWPGNGSFDVPNLPSILQAECGPVLRFSQDRLLMIDTTYLRRAASAASKPEPAAAKGPRIRL